MSIEAMGINMNYFDSKLGSSNAQRKKSSDILIPNYGLDKKQEGHRHQIEGVFWVEDGGEFHRATGIPIQGVCGLALSKYAFSGASQPANGQLAATS